MLFFQIKKILNNPSKILNFIVKHLFNPFLNDESYVKLQYRIIKGKKLDLDTPHTFNEKINWLKLNEKKDLYRIIVDKYEVRKYISEKIGSKYLIPILGIYDKFDDINFNLLPSQFVMKCTHDSGGIIIVKDKYKTNTSRIKRKINKYMKRDFFKISREYPYRNIIPRILIEEYMEDESGYELKDYKVFNINGEPCIIQVHFDRYKDHKMNIYDTCWNLIETNYNNKEFVNIKKPTVLDEMLTISKVLSKEFAFLRTDFYVVNNCLYIGELTLYPGSGFSDISEELDKKLGEKLVI